MRGGDLTFRCNVDYRGAVTNVRISRNDGNYRRYSNWRVAGLTLGWCGLRLRRFWPRALNDWRSSRSEVSSAASGS